MEKKRRWFPEAEIVLFGEETAKIQRVPGLCMGFGGFLFLFTGT